MKRKIGFAALGTLFLEVVTALLFLGCGDPSEEKMKIRVEYLARHAYQQTLLNKTALELRLLNDKLNLLSNGSLSQIPSDSLTYMLNKHFILFMECEKIMEEMKELNTADSILFEMYGCR